ncbi:hypothetical protein [Streptomyces cylindrosporus]|uniref:GerMN domain-containing protein n=1 Tax=Streptomyces cylindrosporus TaxID=2927583 RepID=A0ABS9YGY7_9ACTN|nr:hypothetical protein [Streptomyces cylindrosporus]MCI3275131.1 hypothetical protein [Streptomyces cylindrosporus]
MKARHRLPLLLAPALLALASCDIPATGVVEAGGPASGMTPVATVYFVQRGALVAVPRITDRPGNAETAMALLLEGPNGAEASAGYTTEIPVRPTRAPAAATDSVEPSALPPDTPTVKVTGDRLSIQLPAGMGGLSRLATQQLICTAAAVRRISDPSATLSEAYVTDGRGRRTEGSAEDCPQVG